PPCPWVACLIKRTVTSLFYDGGEQDTGHGEDKRGAGGEKEPKLYEAREPELGDGHEARERGKSMQTQERNVLNQAEHNDIPL
ncbi:MAG: hypothetical protein ACREA4_01820, partial [Nitrososphaera sp.]